MDWLCDACSLAASNPSDQVPAAESYESYILSLSNDMQFTNCTTCKPTVSRPVRVVRVVGVVDLYIHPKSL